MQINRRLFLLTLSAPLYAAARLLKNTRKTGAVSSGRRTGCGVLLLGRWRASAPFALTVLTKQEGEFVEALCSQIIPADEWPGAKEAGVLYYIDKQLSGPLARFAEAYKKGIPALDGACRKRTGLQFMKLSATQQTDFLRSVDGEHSDADTFFQLVIDHTMQGFYGSPTHGGNKDETSWKMLGISDVMEGHKH